MKNVTLSLLFIGLCISTFAQKRKICLELGAGVNLPPASTSKFNKSSSYSLGSLTVEEYNPPKLATQIGLSYGISDRFSIGIAGSFSTAGMPDIYLNGASRSGNTDTVLVMSSKKDFNYFDIGLQARYIVLKYKKMNVAAKGSFSMGVSSIDTDLKYHQEIGGEVQNLMGYSDKGVYTIYNHNIRHNRIALHLEVQRVISDRSTLFADVGLNLYSFNTSTLEPWSPVPEYYTLNKFYGFDYENWNENIQTTRSFVNTQVKMGVRFNFKKKD